MSSPSLRRRAFMMRDSVITQVISTLGGSLQWARLLCYQVEFSHVIHWQAAGDLKQHAASSQLGRIPGGWPRSDRFLFYRFLAQPCPLSPRESLHKICSPCLHLYHIGKTLGVHPRCQRFIPCRNTSCFQEVSEPGSGF